ncbi:MAG: hypothetical protein ACOY90_20940 [Candidatus Zhuqueibacterota bacterium]
MNREKLLLIISICLCLIVMLFTFLDFLCLHDIYKDYVSKFVIKDVKADLLNELPAWTNTAGEWMLVKMSYLIRVIFLVFNIVTLSYCIRLIKK